ncbi:HAMP domain-containing protein [Paracidovorax cattleyae]|uniref:HAMP domain-containing protein n=1 Tax=Paracidovorax cattleyae TaxID=80868 RepID=A0A1H0NMY7_9BURK|nr:HAMP domain-containing protein [Paracidovorax cattleyae]
MEKARDAALAAAQEGFNLADDNIVKADVLSMPSTDWVARMTRITDTQFELVGVSFDVLEQSLDSQIAQLRQGMLVLEAVLEALAAAALWIMAMVTRATTRSIDEAVRIAEAVADGDLTARVEPQGRDEVARLLHALAAMNRKLGTVVGTVRLNAENVASASVQIAQGNADLSQRTESQASALEQTAASMEELGSTIIVDSIRKVSGIVGEITSGNWWIPRRCSGWAPAPDPPPAKKPRGREAPGLFLIRRGPERLRRRARRCSRPGTSRSASARRCPPCTAWPAPRRPGSPRAGCRPRPASPPCPWQGSP